MSYRDKRAAEAEAQNAPLACSGCRRPTSYKALCEFGARCEDCYRSFCNSSPPVPEWMNEGTGQGRGWARRLKAREEAGHALSSFQMACWREALKREIA